METERPKERCSSGGRLALRAMGGCVREPVQNKEAIEGAEED